MEIPCVWEHNGEDTLLYAVNFPGAYTRGANLAEAMAKMPAEIKSYAAWSGFSVAVDRVAVMQGVPTSLRVADADSDVLFYTESMPLTGEEYETLKELALKSAEDFLLLYRSVPEKTKPLSSPRQTFYGPVPSSAEEMYLHTKNVNAYYFAEIGVAADNEGDIVSCRRRGFAMLEKGEGFLENPIFAGSYGENWNLRKVLRRFLWHDRIHGKALYRRAAAVFGAEKIPDVFFFQGGSTL